MGADLFEANEFLKKSEIKETHVTCTNIYKNTILQFYFNEAQKLNFLINI